MSITGPDAHATSALGKDCFLCHGKLADPAIHWMGASGDIYMHPQCAVELSIRLFRDVHELECRTGNHLEWVNHRAPHPRPAR